MVTELFPVCSDRHYEGRIVMILEFSCGLRLVYKPKDIGIERAFVALADWLNAAGMPDTFKTFKVLPGEGYGWAEYIPGKPVTDAEAASAFYRRSGSLLCLMYVLGATDMHLENLIGQGAYPVPIDLETLMHPFVCYAPGPAADARAKAIRILSRSVLRTGMLPRWHTDQPKQAYDVSMLGGGISGDLRLEWIRWCAINTDNMSANRELMPMVRQRSVSGSFPLTAFGKELIDGFGECYRFLQRHRLELLRSGCWQALAGQRIRFVFRPSRIYAQLHQQLLQPALLKNGALRSRYLNALYAGAGSAEGQPDCRALVDLELEAMERMDIPHFTTRADTTALSPEPGLVLPGYFDEPAYETACTRLRDLNEDDLDQQTALIRSALVCSGAADAHSGGNQKNKSAGKASRLRTDIVLGRAHVLATALSASAIKGDDGSATWLAPRPIPGTGRHQLDPLPHDLFSGLCGIALFFAALYRISGRKSYRDMTARILQTPLRDADALKSRAAGISQATGGLTGWGSVAYSFLRIGTLTGDESYGRQAESAAAMIIPAAIDADRAFDLMHGAAGVIQSLAPLYSCTQHAGLLRTMVHAGDHLLQHQQPAGPGAGGWNTPAGGLLTGYAHGAAGIAAALFSLFRITGSAKYRDAAMQAVAWEQSVFSHEAANWPDLRIPHTSEDAPRYLCAWCHGAAGIGLARLQSLDSCPVRALERDALIALRTTRRFLYGGTDYVCCGNFGRLELLLNASLRYSDRELLKETQEAAAGLLHQAGTGNRFRFHPGLGNTPAFFQGISGIGYQLLRIAFPDELPSILTLS